jgi:diadenosine tetraphosphatase ApaH/serine/threonine PP2A family protein phosphatase
LIAPEPDGNGGFLRPHSQNNKEQHEEFLHQVGEDSVAHKEALEWFQTLPVWLDLPGIRVVHACWHSPAQEMLRPYLDQSNKFTKGGLREASRKGSNAYKAAEVLLKGPEAILPDGRSFKDKQGHSRHEVRLRWWGATTLRTAALGMDGIEASLPDVPVKTDYHYVGKIPVFFGHYWLSGMPVVTGSYAACLDFSVAKNGFLTAHDEQRFHQ